MTPADIPTVNRALKRAFETGQAPIIELIQAQTQDPFKVLIATILSARTLDQTTAEVARRLFAEVPDVAALRAVSLEALTELLYPVGFYRTKAKQLKQLPEVLEREFGGVIPETIDGLCKLPGVGRKTANLVVAVAFDKYGICVDVHVHRIMNRLGLIRTRTPYDTEMALRELLPRRYWKRWNCFLVSFGQTRCRPLRPKCEGCPIHAQCDRVGVQA